MDIDQDDVVEREKSWTELSWLEKQQRLDYNENVGHAAWIAPSRAQVTKAAEAKKKTSVEVSGETSSGDEEEDETAVAVFEPPATAASADMLCLMPGAELGHILFRCSLLDIMALRVTCRAMHARLSGKPIHQLDLAKEGGVLVAAFSAVKAARESGDLSILDELVIPVADLIITMGQRPAWGYFNYGKFFARSSRYANVPTSIQRRISKGGVYYSTFISGAKAYRSDHWKTDDASQAVIVQTAKARFSSGTFCMGCLMTIEFGRALPLAWSEFALLPTTAICYTCANLYRVFPLAGHALSHAYGTLPSSVYFPDTTTAGAALACPKDQCKGKIRGISKLSYTGVKGTRVSDVPLGLLWCTDPDHTGFIHSFRWRSAMHLCTQEVDHWKSGNDTRKLPDIKKLADQSAYSRDFIAKTTGRAFNTWTKKRVVGAKKKKKKKPAKRARVVVVEEEEEYQ